MAGKSYYLATAAAGGSDANSGLSPSAPWLTPNHPVNCGDVITAAASASYSWANFYTGEWGTVSCPAGNNVAWLKCATFDACKITTSIGVGMWIDKSYWGVQGWEVSTAQTDQYGNCFYIAPNYDTPVSISHIILANNIVNGCAGGGFVTDQGSDNATGVDYVAWVGNIAYGSATSTTGICASGMSFVVPKNSDTLPGTHIYIAGNFGWNNVDGDPCAGGAPTDGEGLILDTINKFNYSGQIVVQNNVFFLNGGRGIITYNSSASNVYIKNNTLWDNATDPFENSTICGDLQVYASSNVSESNNLIAESNATGCGKYPLYAMSVGNADATSQVFSNYAYGTGGQNTQIISSGGFAYGAANILGTNPAFKGAPTSNPGAPSCGSASSVPNCMATVIANFTPTTAAAAAYGYQVPSIAQSSDPLFPQWLCNVNLPTGLVTMGCPSAP
jgi:hypothetical protein